MNTNDITLNSLRILPKEPDFLDKKQGTRGEILFDNSDVTLRLYNGAVPGGIALLRADLENVEGVIGAAVGDNPPQGENVKAGTIWFNTVNGKLFILYQDGDSLQWVQPATPSVGGGSGGGGGGIAGNYVASISTSSGLLGGQAASEGAAINLSLDTNVVATVSGTQTLTNKTINGTENTLSQIPNSSLINSTITINGTTVSLGGSTVITAASSINELTDVDLVSPVAGQVLKYNGNTWINGDSTVNIIAGNSAIGVSENAGTISIANLGVTQLNAGTGISLSGNTGSINIVNGGVTSITAGANITVSASVGAITISAANPGGYDQSLNTTDDVEFNSISAASIFSTGTGTPTITSGNDVIINASSGTGQLQVTGSIRATKFLTLVPLSVAPSVPAGTFAVADRVNWDPATKGSGAAYPVFYNGTTWNALY